MFEMRKETAKLPVNFSAFETSFVVLANFQSLVVALKTRSLLELNSSPRAHVTHRFSRYIHCDVLQRAV